MNKTPTLAKSNTSSVAVNVELGLAAESNAEVVVAAAEVVVSISVDDAGGHLVMKVFVIVMVVAGGIVVTVAEDAIVDGVMSVVNVVVDD